MGHAAFQLGPSLSSDRLRQSWCGSQRQAVRGLFDRADGRRCHRRPRPRWRFCGTCRRGIDGRGNQPSDGGATPQTRAVVDAGVHRMPQPAMAQGVVGTLDADRARAGNGRDDRRGRTLGDGAAFVSASRACLRMARTAGDGSAGACVRRAGASDPRRRRHAGQRTAHHRRADARDRRQPRHLDAARRQRGDRRSHLRCGAGRDLGCCARFHDRTRQYVQQDPQGIPATRQSADRSMWLSAR